jgi:hypothetical protein
MMSAIASKNLGGRPRKDFSSDALADVNKYRPDHRPQYWDGWERDTGRQVGSQLIGRRVNLTKKIGSFWAGTEFDVVRCYRDSRVGTCLLDLECGNGVLTRVSLFDVERI